MEAFRRRIEAGQPIIINGDGSQRRDLTHVADDRQGILPGDPWGENRRSFAHVPVASHGPCGQDARATWRGHPARRL